MNTFCHVELYRGANEPDGDAFIGTITIREKYEVPVIGQAVDDQIWIVTIDRERYFYSRLSILQMAHEIAAQNDVVRRYLLEGYYPRLFLSTDGKNLNELILNEEGVLEIMNETDLPLKGRSIPAATSLLQNGMLLFARVFFLAIIIQIIVHIIM